MFRMFGGEKPTSGETQLSQEEEQAHLKVQERQQQLERAQERAQSIKRVARGGDKTTQAAYGDVFAH